MLQEFKEFAIKGINRMKREQGRPVEAAPAPPRQEVLLAEIRDLLKAR